NSKGRFWYQRLSNVEWHHSGCSRAITRWAIQVEKRNTAIFDKSSRVRRETAWKYSSCLSQVLCASGCDRLLYAEIARRKIESPPSVDSFETRRVRRVEAFARNGYNA